MCCRCERLDEDSSCLKAEVSVLRVESESALTESDVRTSAGDERLMMPQAVAPRSKKNNIPPPFTLQKLRDDTSTPEQVKNVTDNP